MSKDNEQLLRSILQKGRDSVPLNDEERIYQRKLFSDMMGSKKIVQKTVRILTGEQLRKERNTELKKAKTDAEPNRKDPRYTEGKNPSKIEGENPNPTRHQADSKIMDADLKPKEIKSEQERLGDKTQNPILPRTEAAKFVSLDPVKAGDIVIKNIAKSGQLIVKGVVLKVDAKNQTAIVKWGHGRTMVEFSHTLVKAKKVSEGAVDPKLGVPEAEEEAKNPPVTKLRSTRRTGTTRGTGRTRFGRRRSGRTRFGSGRTGRRTRTRRSTRRWGGTVKAEMSPDRLAESKTLAEQLKGKENVDNPHALARWMVQRGKKYTEGGNLSKLVREFQMQKDGDIASGRSPMGSTPAGETPTPFEDLTHVLQQTISLAAEVKTKQNRVADTDVKKYYSEILKALRGISESLLASLSMELTEAQEAYDGTDTEEAE